MEITIEELTNRTTRHVGISFLPEKKKICVLSRSVGGNSALLDNITMCGRVVGNLVVT